MAPNTIKELTIKDFAKLPEKGKLYIEGIMRGWLLATETKKNESPNHKKAG